MEQRDLTAAREWIRQELDGCVEFWLRNGMDAVNGGVYTCLDRTGAVYSTDKSVWMQGRCGWIFSYLCSVYGPRDEWMSAAKSCLDFMEAHCVNRGAGERMYFTVTAEGAPLRQRRYCFSEAFYAMANAEYYGLTGEAEYLDRARRAYNIIYRLHHGEADPTGLGPKTISATRSGRALADPMIFLNVTSILRRCDPAHADEYDAFSRECTDDIFKYHFKPELGCTLENVGPGGEFQGDFTAGRMVNPGHDIECSWFLMEEANRRGDSGLRAKAVQMFDNAFSAGWDRQYGGLLYFLDCLGKPPEAYEHDMKLWWPHNEILIASLMIYRDTGDALYKGRFLETLDYCKTHFADPAYGEWYGYLRRDGVPTAPPCKGSTFKGPFHVPRSLIMTERMLDGMLSGGEA